MVGDVAAVYLKIITASLRQQNIIGNAMHAIKKKDRKKFFFL